jgi:outer membrane protein assembly factor BamA
MPIVRRESRVRVAGSVVALVLAAVVAVAADPPNGKIVADVIPVNNRVHPTEHILSQMTTRAGRAYDEAAVQEDVRKLLATHWFAPGGVRVSTEVGSDGRVTVYVNVIELNNIVNEVVFKGNNHYSEKELLNVTGLRRGGPMNPHTNELAARTILEKYKDDGRLFTSVRLTEGDKLTDNRVAFEIVEGPVVRVEGVEFRGNQVSKSAWLATQVSVHGPYVGVVNPLTPKFNAQGLDADRKKLLDYYHQLGFVDVKIPAPEIVPGADLSTVTIVWTIDEGQRYTVRNVRVEGNTAHPEDRLKALVDIKPAQRYDLAVVLADAKRIKDLYGNSGYAVLVEPTHFAVPGQPGEIDLVYKVMEPPPLEQPVKQVQHTVNQYTDPPPPQATERPPDRVGQIVILGNTKTANRVILNELGNLSQGQILRYPELEAARLRLASRGIFDTDDPPTIEVVDDPAAVDPTYKTVIVRVKETRTGNFGLTLGVNSDAGLTGGISIVERNFDILRVPTSFEDLVERNAFRGGGQTLNIDLRPGTTLQTYSIGWREPYFLDSKFGLGVQGYFFNRAYTEYTEDRWGGRVTVDRRLDPIWRAYLATRVEGVNLHNIPAWASPAITDFQGQSNLLGLRPGVTRDTRDSPILPTSGSLLDVGVEQVFGTYTFPIGTAEYTQFFTSDYFQRKDGRGKHVLALRSQIAVAGSNTPVFERFYAGGYQSLRGFSFRGVGPVENDLFIGGKFSFLNSVEYQIPVLASEKLFFDMFVDHGTVENTVEIRNYRVSAGFGFRIMTPLSPAPLALDFSFPIVKAPWDNKQMFSFSFGGVFGGR